MICVCARLLVQSRTQSLHILLDVFDIDLLPNVAGHQQTQPLHELSLSDLLDAVHKATSSHHTHMSTGHLPCPAIFTRPYPRVSVHAFYQHSLNLHRQECAQ